MYTPFKMKGPSLYKFNTKLRAASAAGDLDDNPKFKAAVDASPKKKYKDSAMKKKSCGSAYKKYGKKSAMKMKPCPGCKTMCAGCKGKRY